MTNLEIQEFVGEQFQDNPFIETNMDFKEKDVKLQNPAEVGGVDKTLGETLTNNHKMKIRLPKTINLKPEMRIFPDQL